MLSPRLKAIRMTCVDTAGPFSIPESIGQATCPGNQTVTHPHPLCPTLSPLQQVGLLLFSPVWMPLFQKASGP